MEKTMFIIAGYCADYPGNFIASLIALEKKLDGRVRIVYFLRNGGSLAFKKWFSEFSESRECYLIGCDKLGRKRICELVRKEKPSYLYFHFDGFSFPISVYRDLSKKERNDIQVLYHVHSTPSLPKTAKERIKRLGSRILCPKSLIFIACSDAAADVLKGIYPHNKVYNNPNKIDFSRLKFNPGKKPDPQNMAVLTFCYNYEVKGGDIAAGIAKKLHEKHPNFRLLMVVARNEEEIRRRLANDFPDYQDYIDILPPSSDVSSLYDLSTVYLLPSRSEGFSYACVEASYSGLVAICSNLPALRDAKLPRLELFPIGDVDAAAALIEKHFSSEPVLAKESDYQRYDLSSWASEEERILKEISND